MIDAQVLIQSDIILFPTKQKQPFYNKFTFNINIISRIIYIYQESNIIYHAGDSDPAMKLVAETSKLIGNSVYGRSLMNKRTHKCVEFTSLNAAAKRVNSSLFVSLEEFNNNTFEVSVYIHVEKREKIKWRDRKGVEREIGYRDTCPSCLSINICLGNISE